MSRGLVILIGGREATRGEPACLRRFVTECGGRGCRVAVIGVASEDPRAVRETYEPVFAELGAEVRFLMLPDRGSAFRPEAEAAVGEADGLFFAGGDQLRITSLLGGTPVARAVRRRWEEGAVLAGTSAGASAMSQTMIVGGEGDAPPTLNTIRMAPGLGILEGAVVDQHFAQRGRIGRLLSALAQNPDVLGIGLDEDTALAVGGDGVAEVVGTNTVTFLDAREASGSNASEARSSALALTDVRLHVLPGGYRFDLRSRRPLPPRDGEVGV